MIRHIVFDMGNVLIRFDPWALTDGLNVPAEGRERLYREVFGSVEWVRLDRGTLTEEEAAEGICRRLPEELRAAARKLVCGWWKLPLVPIEGMEELLYELKALGYGVYLLSNASFRLHDYFPRIPGAACFDGKIVSSDWKLLKPQHEIYEKLLEVCGLRAEECFFVDDIPANVEGALNAGIAGTVFDGNAARLRRALRDAGVPVKE